MTDKASPTLPMDTANDNAMGGFLLPVVGAVGFVHLLNDLIQSMLPAIYPLLKNSFALNFTQVGLITLTYQLTASILQPWVGYYTDKYPKPYLLPIGMAFTFMGVLLLSRAANFEMLLLASALIGVGSSTFHPEASRVARMASGGRFGFAQSLFQVGGNAGSALGPLLAALIIIPHGQTNIAWFGLFAILAIMVLFGISRWTVSQRRGAKFRVRGYRELNLSRRRIMGALLVLALLLFSKYIYLASVTSYYTFYLIDKFSVTIQTAQLFLFLFLAAIAVGTLVGGPIGDRIGRKYVIWVSILGSTPFTVLLPYANLFWTGVLSVVIGLVLASAFSAIVVFAQELLPARVGMISGVFFGLMFGIGGVSAAALGYVADTRGIEFVYSVCSFLPLLGVITILLPDIERPMQIK